MLTIHNEFDLEEIVYLVTDPDQFERMITRIVVGIGKVVLYELSCGTSTSLHYPAEITKKKDFVLLTGATRKEAE